MAPDRTPIQFDGPAGAAGPAGPTTLACPGGGADRPAGPVLGTDCWILSGPTAAGKTALALALAGRLDAEIVSVDSMAVYRGLDIGTAKPSPHEQARVPHHVIAVVPPGEPYSIARWLADAAAALHAIRGRGRRILFVGGTPLYLRALRDGLAPLPAEDPEFRRQLLDEVDTHGSAAVHARLAPIDPVAAANESVEAPAPVGDRGLVDEVRQAAAQPGGIGPTARQAAGYAECLELLAGRLAYAEAIRLTQQRTRQLAKRQLTWLRSFKGAVWITA